MIDYLVYDVFTKERFAGNPLAVIPDATGLAPEMLPIIAREFNFSETTFVYPPTDPAHTAKVRIFTPASELQFAGHPTVGTAIALNALGRGGADMVLELGVGPIPVTVSGSHARFTTRVPLEARETLTPSQVAACGGLLADAIVTASHRPVEAGLGTSFILAEVGDTATLSTAQGSADAFRAAGPEAAHVGLFLYVRDGQTLHARMFEPLAGIDEDPATGSASAALAAFLGKLDGRSQSFDINQGVDMGRPSRIEAEVTVEGGAPVAVAIGGHAVKVMEGTLSL